MLKLRLKRIGRKSYPVYRLVVIANLTKRDGKPIDEVGYYNPMTKQLNFESDRIKNWLNKGVQPTKTVFYLLKKARII